MRPVRAEENAERLVALPRPQPFDPLRNRDVFMKLVVREVIEAVVARVLIV